LPASTGRDRVSERARGPNEPAGQNQAPASFSGQPSPRVGVVTTFSVRFLGCKVSYSDSEEIRERLLREGHEEANPGRAEVAIVNTCCVTGEALSKSRQAIARAARTHERVYATGCGASLEGAFSGSPENVVVVPRRKEGASEAVAGLLGRVRAVERAPGERRVRAFVTIQDGCSFRCSYCVVPLVRGPGRSKSAASVLAEVRRRVEQGHKEVVLSGINLGCFRDREASMSLAGLVREVGMMPGLERLRLSSIEVNHLSRELLAAVRETPTCCRHLHVPLQSGDDRILRAMGRRYDSATFLRRLDDLGDFNLTTDAIVGFPDEDELAFERTLAVIERAGITKVHVFPYSPRPGTTTARADDVPARVKRERAARLRESSKNACLLRWRGKIGNEESILIDRPGRGYADDYTLWLVDGKVGELVRARAESVSEQGITGVRTR
jgi:threonylcarbamoyladenosine tRNA methylthiotransferase MtaB